MLRLKYFCENTVLHGFKYIAEPQRHRSEKLFWSCALIISVFLTGILIFNLAKKIEKHPIVTLMSDTPISVKEINFPAVSFCPVLELDTISFDYFETMESLLNGSILLSSLTEKE